MRLNYSECNYPGYGRLRHQTAGSDTGRHVSEPDQPAHAQAPTSLDRPLPAQPANAGTYRPRQAKTIFQNYFQNFYPTNAQPNILRLSRPMPKKKRHFFFQVVKKLNIQSRSSR